MATDWKHISVLKDLIEKVTNYEGLKHKNVVIYIEGEWAHRGHLMKNAEDLLGPFKNKIEFIIIDGLDPKNKYYQQIYQHHFGRTDIFAGHIFYFFKKGKFIGVHTGTLVDEKRQKFLDLLEKLVT